MKRNRILRIIAQVLLGPLPATVILGPFLLLGLVGTVGALLTPFPVPISEEPLPGMEIGVGLRVQLAIVAAASILGLLSLWILIFADLHAVKQSKLLRIAFVTALFAGIGAAAYGSFILFAIGGNPDYTVSIAIGLILTGPTVLAIRYLFLLLRRVSTPAA